MDSAEDGVKRFYRGEVAQSYLDDRTDHLKWNREQTVVKNIVDRYMAEGTTVLDVPFGTGRFAKLYLERGVEVYGLDISPDMLEVAREQLGPLASDVHLVQGDAGNLPFECNSLDYLVCIRLLNWVPIESIDRFFREFTRVACSKLVIGVRTRSSVGIYERARKSLRSRPFHFTIQSAKSFMKLLWRRLTARKRETKSKADSRTFFIHKKSTILQLFRRHGLGVIELTTIDEHDYSPLWVIAPLQVYVLSKEASHSL